MNIIFHKSSQGIQQALKMHLKVGMAKMKDNAITPATKALSNINFVSLRTFYM